jgi:AcrR family transcriptional regulator
VAADQRERLFAALVVLADERGYEPIRVEDLIALAGISRGAFYEQFGGKEECMAAAVEELVALMLREQAAALEGAASPPAGARGAIDAFVAFAAAQSAAARLALVDAYGAGPAAVARARRGADGLEELLGQAGAAGVPDRDELPSDLLGGLVGGLRRTVATRLRRRHVDELPALAPPLGDWLLGYAPPPAPLRRPRANAGTHGGPRHVPQDQAERILSGVCEAVAEKGYAATTLADVAARAATSIRTFYAHYESKEEAFVDALDLAQTQSYAAVLAASRRAPDWPHAVRNGLHALCGYYAADPIVARATIVEVHAAGEAALRRHDEAVDALARLLEPGRELAPDTPEIAPEAIGGAIDTLLYDAVEAGAGPKLRAVAPTATYIALAPFIGAEAACEVANDIGQPRRRGRSDPG